MERKYNRAFIKSNDVTDSFIREILDNTSDEDMEYWVLDSKESFHGHHDNEYFYFADSRIEYNTKLPLFCVELEFTEDDLGIS